MLSEIDVSWHEYLKPLLESSSMKYIKEHILNNPKLCPTRDKVFKVLRMPLSEIEVVILGREPYLTIENNTGLAFAYPEGKTPSYLLWTIINEIAISYSLGSNLEGGEKGEFQENLEHWVDEKVFLLNQSLTTLENQKGVHYETWKGFTNYIIELIAKHNKKVIFVLWGKEAQDTKSIINKYSNGHEILESIFPTNEKIAGGFIGCNHFNIINDIRFKQNRPPIMWVSEDDLPF